MRRYERQAARNYIHAVPHRSCSMFTGRLMHGCLRCYWRDLTGRTRRERHRLIAEMRERKARTPVTPWPRWRE